MSYSYKLDKAVDQTPSGNLENYFDYLSMSIQPNDGRSDNKCLSIDAYDPPCPVAKGMYTKLKLTDESVNVINMDKSSITAVVRFTVNTTTDIDPQSFDLHRFFTLTSASDTFKKILNDYEKMAKTYNKIFIGFKSSIHVLDAYRIYSNGKKTLCEQTEALFENAACRMIKCQEELDEKPGIYTTWEHAYHYDEEVCGCYIGLYDLISNGSVTLEFELTIPIDEFLPFQAMSLFPNCIFGNLQIEIKMAIQNNFVCCQVKPSETFVESTKAMLDVYGGEVIREFQSLLEGCDLGIKKAFTQCGDSFNVTYISVEGTALINTPSGSDGLGYIIDKLYSNSKKTITLEITSGSLMSCRTNLNGFNIKDDVIENLRRKFSDEPLVIPSQFIDYQAFSQPPMSFGLKCNTTYNLTNCSSILFLFPRTSHEITCSRNPFLASIQVQIDNKPYPDKPFSTLEAAHTIYNLTNLGYDSLFSTSKEYSYALNWNEISSPIMTLKNMLDEDIYITEKESEDNTSYCFVCSTERLSGFGTFCDGLNKDNAHITLTGTLASLPQGVQYHPYYQPEGQVNVRPPIMLICQDCFWVCTPENGMEFIINDKQFYKRLTEGGDARYRRP